MAELHLESVIQQSVNLIQGNHRDSVPLEVFLVKQFVESALTSDDDIHLVPGTVHYLLPDLAALVDPDLQPEEGAEDVRHGPMSSRATTGGPLFIATSGWLEANCACRPAPVRTGRTAR